MENEYRIYKVALSDQGVTLGVADGDRMTSGITQVLEIRTNYGIGKTLTFPFYLQMDF